MMSSTIDNLRLTPSNSIVRCSMFPPAAFCAGLSFQRFFPLRHPLIAPQAIPFGMASISRIMVLQILGSDAEVLLPDGEIARWSGASLPRDVQVGDLVRITEEGGDFTAEIEWIGRAHHA